MSAPPLAPELWNCGAVVVAVGLCGWAVRLLRLGLQLIEMHRAARQEATVHLRDLGPSLLVLQCASMWHLQQLLRTKKEATAADMPRVRVPFEVAPSSLRFVRSVDEDGRVRMTLAVGVASTEPCAVQVLWNVRADALERSPRRQRSQAGSESGDRKLRVAQLPRSVFRRLGMADSIRGSRSLPWMVSSERRQARRHRLDDDRVDEGPAGTGNGDAALGWLLVGPGAFSAQSPVEIIDGRGRELAVEVPAEALLGPHESEEASLALEAERDDAAETAASARAGPDADADAEPRYGAVVVVAVPSLLAQGSGSPDVGRSWPATSRRKRSAPAEAEEAVCVCVAVDFLPTPARADAFTPAVVKRLIFTADDVYTLQDIFGRDASAGGECVICLEGEPSAVLLPCRHQCVCRACLEEIERCPICRAKFSTYVCFAEAPAPAAAAGQQLQVKVVDPL